MISARISRRRATLLSLRGRFARERGRRKDGQQTDKEREQHLALLPMIQGVCLNRFSLPPLDSSRELDPPYILSGDRPVESSSPSIAPSS
jgi:hypothetical protein